MTVRTCVNGCSLLLSFIFYCRKKVIARVSLNRDTLLENAKLQIFGVIMEKETVGLLKSKSNS